MASTAALDLVISLKAEGAERGLKTMATHVSALGTAVGTFAGGAALAGVRALGGAVSGFLGDAIQESRDAAHGLAQTESVIKSTGGAAQVTAAQIVDMAGALSHSTLFTDDAIQADENLLLTFTNLKNGVGAGNDIFTQATKVSLDLAQAMGTDASGGAIQLGKALNDPTAGISALTRVGVTFSDQQKEQIKTLQENGDLMGAQKIILAELNKEFGGSAEAAAQADGGYHQFQQTLADVKQTVGDALQPALQSLMGFMAGPGLMAVQSLAEAFAGALPGAIAWLTGTGLPGLISAFTSLWNIGQLLMTGDFSGGIFGLDEDSALIDFLFQVRDGFGLVRDAVTTFVQALQGDWVNSSGILPLHAAIGELGLFISGTLVPAFMSFIGFVQTNAGPILVGLGTMLVAVVVPAFVAWAAAAAASAAATIAAIAPIAIPIAALGLAAAALYAAWSTNFLGIRDITAAVWSSIVALAQPVIATLTRFWTEIQPQLNAAWTNIQQVAITAWTAISTGISTALTAISGFLTTHAAEMQTILQGAWTAMQGVVQVAWSLISGIIKTGLALLAGDWQGAWTNFQTMLTGIWEGIKGIVSGEVQALGGIIRAVGPSLMAAAQSIGQDIIAGIKAGISAGAGAIASALQGVAASALSAAKAALGIHSPSKVFADEVGTPIVEGMALGILATMPELLAAMRQSVDSGIQEIVGFIDSGDTTSTLNASGAATINEFIAGMRRAKAGTAIVAGVKLGVLAAMPGLLAAMRQSMDSGIQEIVGFIDSGDTTSVLNAAGAATINEFIAGMNKGLAPAMRQMPTWVGYVQDLGNGLRLLGDQTPAVQDLGDGLTLLGDQWARQAATMTDLAPNLSNLAAGYTGVADAAKTAAAATVRATDDMLSHIKMLGGANLDGRGGFTGGGSGGPLSYLNGAGGAGGGGMSIGGPSYGDAITTGQGAGMGFGNGWQAGIEQIQPQIQDSTRMTFQNLQDTVILPWQAMTRDFFSGAGFGFIGAASEGMNSAGGGLAASAANVGGMAGASLVSSLQSNVAGVSGVVDSINAQLARIERDIHIKVTIDRGGGTGQTSWNESIGI